MTIDIHTHIYRKGWVPEEIVKYAVEDMARRTGIAPREIMQNPDKYPSLYEATPEDLIKDMDEAGIKKAVVFPIDFGLAPGLSKPKASIEEINKTVADAAYQYSDRLIAFVGVDPRRKNAVAILEKGVREWGMKGLKLYQPCGFYPNEPVVTPVWEKANELRIPVVVHSGATFPQLRMKYSQPIYLEDVLVRYPDVNVIIAHLGGGIWTEEVIALRQMRDNVYSDTGGWQGIFRTNREYATQKLTEVYSVLRSKCLFGSDWPGFSVQMSTREWVGTINGLEKVKDRFKKKLLSENAEKLLNLRKER